MRRMLVVIAVVMLLPQPASADVAIQAYALPSAGGYPHDVAVGSDGIVWYTAQPTGQLGRLDPATGKVDLIPLGKGAAPHGVVIGPDGAPWITEGGTNAIVRVDPQTSRVKRFPLRTSNANLNTAAFDGNGILWFTGQAGIYGKLDPRTGIVTTYDARRGRGPYGIDADPSGVAWYSSLAGSYLARIRSADGRATVFDIPTDGGGGRRVWSDSTGKLWVTEWFAGKLARFDPGTSRWREWNLPGSTPQPYAVFVDDRDIVWVTDFGSNSLLRFDPTTERFRSFNFPSAGAEVRQLLGRPGEVWGAESGTDKLVVLRTS